MNKSVNHKYMPLLLSAAIAMPSIAYAQLEEVIVTSERREASVQDVPVAVSAFNEELVEQLRDSMQGKKHSPRQHSWFEGMKNFFGDMKL